MKTIEEIEIEQILKADKELQSLKAAVRKRENFLRTSNWNIDIFNSSVGNLSCMIKEKVNVGDRVVINDSEEIFIVDSKTDYSIHLNATWYSLGWTCYSGTREDGVIKLFAPKIKCEKQLLDESLELVENLEAWIPAIGALDGKVEKLVKVGDKVLLTNCENILEVDEKSGKGICIAGLWLPIEWIAYRGKFDGIHKIFVPDFLVKDKGIDNSLKSLNIENKDYDSDYDSSIDDRIKDEQSRLDRDVRDAFGDDQDYYLWLEE